MGSDSIHWPIEAYTLKTRSTAISMVADEVYERACRTSLDRPGFCVMTFDDITESEQFRRTLIELTRELAVIHLRRTDRSLVVLSASRFDQQVSTKPHLDGGPDQSLLVLGYEPTNVPSVVEIIDYSACAERLGLSPSALLAHHNPMFQAGAELLRPYSTELRSFVPGQFQIVVINNSSTTFDGQSWLGTLHTATITKPDETQRRVINSVMLASMPLGTPEPLTPDAITDFIKTDVVHRRGYDKPHLTD